MVGDDAAAEEDNEIEGDSEHDDEEACEKDEGTQDNEKTGADQWQAGWNLELQLAWRRPAQDPEAPIELAAPITAQALNGLGESDAVLATFAGGVRLAIAEMSVRRWKALTKQTVRAVLWEKEAMDTKHRVHIAQRTDRKLLCSVYEQGRQVCAVNTEDFGTLPEPQPSVVPVGHPALTAAVDFLIPLAELFCQGKYDGQSIKVAKHEKLNSLRQADKLQHKATRIRCVCNDESIHHCTRRTHSQVTSRQ